MIDHIQRRMIGHAALILFIGMLAGFGLLVSLIGGIELIPGTVIPISIFGGTDAWVRAHTGGILNALLILGVALALPLLRFQVQAAGRIKWMIVSFRVHITLRRGPSGAPGLWSQTVSESETVLGGLPGRLRTTHRSQTHHRRGDRDLCAAVRSAAFPCRCRVGRKLSIWRPDRQWLAHLRTCHAHDV